MLNPEIVGVVEIQGRTRQGATMPFKCVGNDGELYFVKSLNCAGRRGLLSEWIGTSLANRFGLPVAPFTIVDVPPQLLTGAPPELAAIGAGYAFGSRSVDQPLELDWRSKERVPLAVRLDILAFDWWVMNADRTLTELGGNPNLLWSTADREIVVIDHNLAFDDAFSAADFQASHVFASDWDGLFGDWEHRESVRLRMVEAMADLESIDDMIPDDWKLLGDELPVDFNVAHAAAILERCQSDDMWNPPNESSGKVLDR